MRHAGCRAANDVFLSDMALADHQTEIVEYASGFALSFPSNSHVALAERRWYLAGTEGTLIADLVRNPLMLRRALHLGKPERIDHVGLTADAHNGSYQAMALVPLEALVGRDDLPVTPLDCI